MSGIEKIIAVLLVIILILAVYPMEQPGMLYPWLGVEPNIIFHLKLFKFTLLELFLGMAFAMSIMYRFSLSKKIRYKNNFSGIFVMILFCIIWGYLGTILEGGGFSTDNLGVANWKKLIYGMILFTSLSLFIDSREKLKVAIMFIIVAVILLDVYGLFRYIFLGGISVHHYIGKVVFWETVKLALNVFVFVYTLGAIIFGADSISKNERRVYILALLISCLVILLSSRRTSMVMMMVAVCLYLWFMSRRGKMGLAASIAGVGMLLVIAFAALNYEAFETKILSRFESLAGVFDSSVKVDQGSTQGHMQDLILGWETVKEHFIWGVGFAWDDSSKSLIESGGRGRYWVHNSMLTFWMRFGIPGILTYFYLYYRVISVLYRSYKKNHDYMSAAFLIWFFVEFLGGLFFPPFFGYFKMVALFMGSLALANIHLNTYAQLDLKGQNKNKAPVSPVRILRMRNGR